MTKDLIIQSHAGDGSSTLKLIDKFNPLLKKYTYKLNYEDAYNDLLFDFLKFLNTIPLDSIRNPNEGILINYIKKSIHNSYIKE